MNNNGRWYSFDKARLAKNHKSGFLIIKPKKANVIPFVCPVCNMIMRRNDDITSYHEYKACFSCSTYLVIPNKNKWAKGWRPTKEEIKQYIKKVRNIY